MQLLRELQDAIYALFRGSSDATGEFTLAVAPATTTTVTRVGVSTSSVIHPEPTNAAAVAEGLILIVPSKGQFVITHSSSVGTRTYRYSYHTPRRAF